MIFMRTQMEKSRSIRTIYTCEQGKVLDKSGDGAEDVYVHKWIHYERLHFLADFVVAKAHPGTRPVVS